MTSVHKSFRQSGCRCP